MVADRLETHRAKRDFSDKSEPEGRAHTSRNGHAYLLQKHEASHQHFDFRLEHGGVLVSWAVPRGPSMDPSEKRLAVRTEDHPVEHDDASVTLWDTGTWEPLENFDEGLKEGKLKFFLRGKRINGGFTLLRLRSDEGRKQGKENWLLVKEKDEYARAGEGGDFVESMLTVIEAGRSMDEIASAKVELPSSEPAVKDVKRLRGAKKKASPRRNPRTGRAAPKTTAKKTAAKKRK